MSLFSAKLNILVDNLLTQVVFEGKEVWGKNWNDGELFSKPDIIGMQIFLNHAGKDANHADYMLLFP